ncbi:MAG: divergent PAP2 family protein [Treponema sp.]
MFNTLSEQVKSLVTSPVFLAALTSWFSAQFIKTVINILYGQIHSLGELIENLFWKTGGLPSSHSALVTSVATTIGFRNGLGSDIFLLSFAFLMVTVRDAVGVRRASGMQARKINNIGKTLREKGIIEYRAMKEVQGHSPMEVTLGCVLGFVLGLAFSVF